jgi:hypothetical protein
MNRREFVAFGISWAALLAPQVSLAVSRHAKPNGTPLLAIADRRYSDSVRFANAIARAGGDAREIGSDIGTLWFGDLEPRLRQGGFRLAGLTLPSDLFVLERLAGRSRSATLYTGCHDWRGPCSQHRLSGALSLGGPVSALDTAGPDWASALGEALVAAPMHSVHVATRHLTVELAPMSDSPKYLTSWLMTLA